MFAKLLTASVCFCISVPMVLAQETGSASPSIKQLVLGIVARAEAVFSGELQYQEECSFAGEEKPKREFKVIFSGSSWRLDSKQDASKVPMITLDKRQEIGKLKGYLESATISRNGKSLEFKVTPQMDGSIRTVATIASQQPIETSLGSSDSPPVFAGSFWYQTTKEFVQNNIGTATKKPATEVNGVRAEILEWKVANSEKSKAFHEVNELLQNGGLLRVFVSPELGNTLPRVEFLSPDEKPAAVFNCFDFVECTDGIFVPKRVVQQWFNSKGAQFRLAYENIRAKKINETIPDSDFVVQLPVGTHVQDIRSGKSSIIFDITENGPIPAGLEDVMAVESPSFWGRNLQTALVLGGSLAVLLIGSYFGIAKWFARRRKP